MNLHLFDVLAQTSTPDTIRVQRRLEFANLPQDWAAVVTLGIAIASLWWIIRTYRREAREGSTLGMRMFLSTLRCLTFLVLLLVWLEPVLATYYHRHIESYTLVLVDDSASMAISDHYADPPEKQHVDDFYEQAALQAQLPITRRQLAESLLQNQQAHFLQQLAQRNRTKLYSFGSKLRELLTLDALRNSSAEIDSPHPQLEQLSLDLQGADSSTNLSTALRSAVQSLGSAPVAGVVVISDGAFNRGEAVEVLGAFARSAGFGIYTVGVGDGSRPRNARVAELTAPANAFARDPFLIAAGIQTQGLEGQALTVTLSQSSHSSTASPSKIASKQIIAPADGQLAEVVFEHRAGAVGIYNYQVEIEPQIGEAVTEDNRRSVRTHVLDNQMRALLVAGGPSWSYRYLSRLLERDQSFNLSCWLQSADRTAVRDGNTVIDHLPETPAELFEYDAVVLLDPDPAGLTAEFSELLDRHVSRNGAGVIYVAGRKYAASFFRDPTVEDIARLLPVSTDPEADLILNQIGYYQRSSSPIELPETSLTHTLLGTAELQSTGGLIDRKRWSQIGKVYWHYPVRHEKPAATVLMRHGNPRMRNSYGGHVLMAVQFVGSGRSAFIGFDGIWRWRQAGEALHDQFWVRLLRYVAESKLLGGDVRGRIQTDRDQYEVGETVVIRAQLLDPQFEPLTDSTVALRVASQALSAPQTLVMQADPRRGGWYQAQFVPRHSGTYFAEIRLSSPQADDITIVQEFDVRSSNAETRELQLNRRDLRQLARLSAGGTYYDIDQAYALPEQIPDRHETRITKATPEPLWDSGWMLLVLVVLLGSEWALRKRCQLL